MKKWISKHQKLSMMILCVIFGISLYLVEMSPIGARAVGQYNGGYGTFDMKFYSPEMVHQVLESMEPKGFEVYSMYFVVDYFFVLTFGAMQLAILYRLWRRIVPKKGLHVMMAIPIIRGICDIIENTLLFYVIRHTNIDYDGMIQWASCATQGKLWMIRLWSVMIIIGIMIRCVNRSKKDKVIENKGVS